MHDIRISEQVFKELLELAEKFPSKKFLSIIIETSSYLMQHSEFISDKVVSFSIISHRSNSFLIY